MDLVTQLMLSHEHFCVANLIDQCSLSWKETDVDALFHPMDFVLIKAVMIHFLRSGMKDTCNFC